MIIIAIEGGDGAGKTGFASKLGDLLADRGLAVERSKEPTGTAPGRRIKAGRGDLDDALTDRDSHMRQTIKPALDAGRLVVLDRYYASTVVHQCGGSRRAWHEIAARYPRPLWVHLATPPEICFERVNARPDETTTLEQCWRISQLYRGLPWLPVVVLHDQIERGLIAVVREAERVIAGAPPHVGRLSGRW